MQAHLAVGSRMSGYILQSLDPAIPCDAFLDLFAHQPPILGQQVEVDTEGRQVQHGLQLHSVYDESSDAITTWHRNSTKATVDYIWVNRGYVRVCAWGHSSYISCRCRLCVQDARRDIYALGHELTLCALASKCIVQMPPLHLGWGNAGLRVKSVMCLHKKDAHSCSCFNFEP